MLTAQEITAMRQEAERAMPDTAVKVSRTRVRDTYGGEAETLVEGSPFPCELSPLSGDDLLIAQQRHGNKAMWRLDYPVSVNLTSGDRVKISGESYEVLWAPEGYQWEITGRADLARVT